MTKREQWIANMRAKILPAEGTGALVRTEEGAWTVAPIESGEGGGVEFGTTAGTACEGDDPRLSDARAPTTHTHNYDAAGAATAALSAAQSYADGAITSHAQAGNPHAVYALSASLAAIATSGSASNLAAGTVPIARLPTGSSSSTVCIGNDARLSDARTPISHAASHLTTDPIPVRTETAAGLMPANMGRRASRAAAVSIANTLTQVVGFTAAAGTLQAGTVIRFRALGLLTNTTSASTSVLTLRINSASLGATIEASWSMALGTTARTNAPFCVEGEILVVSAGVGGTALGCIAVLINHTAALAIPTTMVASPVACITTQSNVVEMACISGAASTTWNFITATAEIVNP